MVTTIGSSRIVHYGLSGQIKICSYYPICGLMGGNCRMRKVAKKIINKTSIAKNKDTQSVIEFISEPKNVAKMLAATKAGKPALSGIVQELEERFGDCEGMPLNHDGPGRNASNRRNIGWIVRYVMAEYGYTPLPNSDRTRIGADSGSNYFTSASVYKKSDSESMRDIITLTIETNRGLVKDDLWLQPGSEEYESEKINMQKIQSQMTHLGIDYKFLHKYLNLIGYNNTLSKKDIKAMLSLEKIPSIELKESITDSLSFFQKFM